MVFIDICDKNGNKLFFARVQPGCLSCLPPAQGEAPHGQGVGTRGRRWDNTLSSTVGAGSGSTVPRGCKPAPPSPPAPVTSHKPPRGCRGAAARGWQLPPAPTAPLGQEPIPRKRRSSVAVGAALALSPNQDPLAEGGGSEHPVPGREGEQGCDERSRLCGDNWDAAPSPWCRDPAIPLPTKGIGATATQEHARSPPRAATMGRGFQQQEEPGGWTNGHGRVTQAEPGALGIPLGLANPPGHPQPTASPRSPVGVWPPRADPASSPGSRVLVL